MANGIRRTLTGPASSPPEGAGSRQWGRLLLTTLAWALALIIQAALLVLVAELVEVAHGVMNLYLDLAQQQLDLTSLYVAATTPE